MTHFIKTVYCFLLLYSFTTNAQTLGNYPNTSVIAGQNITVTPDAAPISTTSIVAFTHTNFTGVLSVNPVTGKISITNAKQAGTYLVTVKAINGQASVISTFTLTVNTPECTKGMFAAPIDAAVDGKTRSLAVGDFNGDGKQDFAFATDGFPAGVKIRLGNGSGGFTEADFVPFNYIDPISIVIGDFNSDGNQDFATANYRHTVSVKLGNGLGGFSGTTNLAAGENPSSIATGDFNGDGNQDFAVANGGTNTVSIFFGNGLGGFSVATNVVVGTNPYSVAIGDFNGDGKQDFATANSGSNSVSIRLGNGLGGFETTSDLTIGSNPYSIAIGDFNGDGKQDISVANHWSNTASIRLGNGMGGFSGTTNVPVGSGPCSVAIGDYNGDGNQDIAVANTTSVSVSIRLGDGFGNFYGTDNIFLGKEPYSIAVGDFNGDGLQDLATPHRYNSTVSILFGLAAKPEINVKSNQAEISDGDSVPSIVDSTDFGIVTGTLTRTFTIHNTGTADLSIKSINSSNSSFLVNGSPTIVAVGNSASFSLTFKPTEAGVQNAVISIKNDDCDETVFDFWVTGQVLQPTLGNYGNSSVIAGQNTTIFPGEMPVNVSGITAYTNTSFSGVLTVNPVSGMVMVTDAKPAGTYVVTVKAFNGATTVFKTFTLTVTNPLCGNGLFSGDANVEVGKNPYAIAIGDFNADGKQDYLTSNFVTNTVSVWLGDGLGGFSLKNEIPVGSTPRSVAIGDFNGDGKQDIAVANEDSDNISIRLGDGMGGFSGTLNIAVGTEPYFIAVGDFNGDGHQDLAISNVWNNNVSIRIGDGSGGFSNAANVAVGAFPTSIAIGDFNRDGKQDLAVANNTNPGTVSIRLGNGAGGFTGNNNLQVGSNPNSVVIGDFNIDGFQDLAVTNMIENNISIRLGNGSGGFTNGATVAVGTLPFSIAIGDFNSDGKQDLAAVNQSSNSVSIRLGDGSGGFTGTTNVAVGETPWYIGVGDFNNDGKQDFIVSNSPSNVSIRMGEGGEANTWLGLTTDWGSPSNWSLGKVPSACTKVIINTSVLNMPTISGENNTCYSLKLQNGATINIAPGAKLIITGK